ncbi:MAG: hypothetical protein ACIWVG_30925 [Gloeotrichia echinulata HAB0833]
MTLPILSSFKSSAFIPELKQTKVYQEAKQEGKLEAVPLMLNLGATVEQIAESLGLDIELVRLVTAKVNTNEEKSQ